MKELLRSLPDGANDFGNGVIGPSLLDIQRANATLPFENLRTQEIRTKDSGDIIFVSSESKLGRFFKGVFRGVPKRFILPTGAVLSFVAATCSGGGAGEKNTDQNVSNSGLEKAVLAEQYELPFQGTWYLTGGPHNFRLPIGAPINGVVASDLDFAPKPIESCEPGREVILKDWNIVASKSGVVTIVGDEKDKKDPNHSIVQIKHADGISTRYIHSADIKVKKGDLVRQGQVIANPSCEVPPDGYTTGLHLDFSEIDASNNLVDIRGLTFDGWKVDASSKNYQGTLSKNGERTRTANGGRYADANGSIRNDLTNTSNKANKAVVAGPKSPIPPISATVKSKEVFPATAVPTTSKSIENPKPTSVAEKPVEKGWKRHNSPDLPYSVDYPDPWTLRDNIFTWDLTGEMRDKRITDTFTTWAGTQFSSSREPLESGVTLDNFKDSVVREIKEKFEEKWGILVQTSTGKKQVIAGENAHNVQFVIQGNPTPKSYVNWLDSVYIFTKDGYGWIVQLETMRPWMEDTMPVLEKMAQSLTTLPNPGEFKVDQSQTPKSTETPKPTPITERQTQVDWTRFKSFDLPYQIDYPSNWQQLENTFYRETTKANLTKFEVASEPVASWVTIDDYKNRFIQSVKDVIKFVGGNVRITEMPNQSINGQKAWRLDGLVSSPSTTPNRSVTYITIKDGKAWALVYAADASEFDQNLPAFEKMLASFKFLK